MTANQKEWRCCVTGLPCTVDQCATCPDHPIQAFRKWLDAYGAKDVYDRGDMAACWHASQRADLAAQQGAQFIMTAGGIDLAPDKQTTPESGQKNAAGQMPAMATSGNGSADADSPGRDRLESADSVKSTPARYSAPAAPLAAPAASLVTKNPAPDASAIVGPNSSFHRLDFSRTAAPHQPAQDDVTEAITLAECPIGLFTCNGELCLKTEYGNNEGRIDVYIVSSGEFFWGGTTTAKEQRKVLVRPFAMSALSAPGWVRVSERLPPNDTRINVLAWGDGRYWIIDAPELNYVATQPTCRATHWMHLPAIPK